MGTSPPVGSSPSNKRFFVINFGLQTIERNGPQRLFCPVPRRSGCGRESAYPGRDPWVAIPIADHFTRVLTSTCTLQTADSYVRRTIYISKISLGVPRAESFAIARVIHYAAQRGVPPGGSKISSAHSGQIGAQVSPTPLRAFPHKRAMRIPTRPRKPRSSPIGQRRARIQRGPGAPRSRPSWAIARDGKGAWLASRLSPRGACKSG